MLLLNLFFADQWRFQRLPFEEGLTEKGLITELVHRFMQGDIAQILVVSVTRFSSRTQPEHLCHRYPPA